ncbi:MAG: D-tyrosyl-tRNA(Tyr) deacylase [Gammaproteobacteria bacterium]|nr:D-tyrosyl-tRNA(Tyr) deacylase [Gammaproteobacteria bacterium]
MIALLQRVTEARVTVAGEIIGSIGPGVLAFIAVQPQDDEASARRLIERILGYRMFADETGRMNRALREVEGGLLLVPQFTLAADTRKGTRASFTSAAPPAQGEQLFATCVSLASAQHAQVQTGRFGADMQVALINDGPVTFWLEA